MIVGAPGTRLGRGRQNEYDTAMVEDPLIGFEEVVVFMV